MPKSKTTISLTAKELNNILKDALKITGNVEIEWDLKHMPRGKYDDIRDPTALTVTGVTITQKN